MRTIPVLDLMGGRVVRGVGGQRHHYHPVRSQLTASSAPTDVARAIADRFGLTKFYVADLDAIAGAAPAVATFSALRELGFGLWVDAGLRSLTDVAPLTSAGVETLVAGLETLSGPGVLGELCAAHERLVFSLDLFHKQTLCPANWGTGPLEAASRAVAVGVRRLLVLDLARVGKNEGPGTLDLCGWLRKTFPEVELSAGGGVRDRGDLQQLQQCGVKNVLVASAFHDGRLAPMDLLETGEPGT